MIAFPNAKINLGLNILAKRKDGFHDIESCLYPIDLCDVLEIVESKTFSFESSGIPIPGDASRNLVIKAYNLLAKPHQLPPVSIHLHKVIPMGGGLGGGSSDGVFALSMLNELFELGLSGIQLHALASQLGSDCPFFLENEAALATGRGTSLEKIEVDLSKYEIRLKHPNVHVSTAEAYAMIKPAKPKLRIVDVLNRPIEEWQGLLINDFEKPMLDKYPAILQAKNELQESGAIYTAMTGSGSTVFGVFER